MKSLLKSTLAVPMVAVSIASLVACSGEQKQEPTNSPTASASAVESPSASPSEDAKAQELKRDQEQRAQESQAAASKQAEQERLAAEQKAKAEAAAKAEAQRQAADKAAAQKRAAEQAAREKQGDREAALRDPWIGGQWTYAYEQGNLDADDRAWVEANGLAPGGVNTPEYQEAHQKPLMDDDVVPSDLSDQEMAEWERQWEAENPSHN